MVLLLFKGEEHSLGHSDEVDSHSHGLQYRNVDVNACSGLAGSVALAKFECGRLLLLSLSSNVTSSRTMGPHKAGFLSVLKSGAMQSNTWTSGKRKKWL